MELKRKPVQLRVPVDTLELIDKAARQQRLTRTDFVIEAARRFAIDTMLDQQEFRWGKEDLKTFEISLEKSDRTSENTVSYLKTRPVWEA